MELCCGVVLSSCVVELCCVLCFRVVLSSCVVELCCQVELSS